MKLLIASLFAISLTEAASLNQLEVKGTEKHTAAMSTCELKFDKDVPGIYEGSEVEILDGQAAVEAMAGNNELYHGAFLDTIYHP